MMILAADIGGTNCRLALGEEAGILHTRRVPTALLRSPEDLIALLLDFLGGAVPKALALSLAGPVTQEGGMITATGLAIPRGVLEEAFPHTPLSLLNDLEAFAQRCQDLGGRPLPLADAAYAFSIAADLPVAVLYWIGDADFPAEAKVLFEDLDNVVANATSA